MLFFHILGALVFPATIAAATNACYDSNVRSTPSADHRQVPWGSPSVHFSSLNGTTTTCCNSLDEIRDALDKIDDELLDLLNSRQVQAYLPLVLASFVEVTKAGPNTRSSDLQGYLFHHDADIRPSRAGLRTSAKQLGSSRRGMPSMRLRATRLS